MPALKLFIVPRITLTPNLSTDADQFPVIDVTIDGADDVDWALNAIKGGGACHLREKVLAEAAEEFVIVADYRKNNMLLGKVSIRTG
jgi:ribose 5-phosphate isomerase